MKSIKAYLFVVFVSGLALASCINNGSQPSIRPERFSTISAHEYWDQAISLASTNWPGSYLREFSAGITLDSSAVESAAVSYTFTSNQSDDVSFVVGCDIDSCKTFEIEHSDRFPIIPCDPIDLSDPLIDSTEALTLAITEGGIDQIYSDTVRGQISLSRGYPACTKKIYWIATFHDRNGVGGHVFIDATTGKIVKDQSQ